MSEKSPDEKGLDLLAMWQAVGDAPLKFPVASDVQEGDAVYLSAESGRYEKVTTDSPFHGIFRDNAVIIPVFVNDKELFLRHSLIDGQMTPGVWKMDEE